jgi:hypothetical protein
MRLTSSPKPECRSESLYNDCQDVDISKIDLTIKVSVSPDEERCPYAAVRILPLVRWLNEINDVGRLMPTY